MSVRCTHYYTRHLCHVWNVNWLNLPHCSAKWGNDHRLGHEKKRLEDGYLKLV